MTWWVIEDKSTKTFLTAKPKLWHALREVATRLNVQTFRGLWHHEITVQYGLNGRVGRVWMIGPEPYTFWYVIREVQGITCTVGEDVQAGDFLVSGEDGLLYKAWQQDAE